MLQLFNYRTRKKERFRPLRDKRVGMYTCGPTVYHYAHIGNFRTYIFEDVLSRTLEYAGYAVKQVMNITDVDDKTIRDSKKAGTSLKTFTDFYAKEFFKDIKKLNVRQAWKYPRATAHIKEMVALIRALLKKKLAYATEDGVYFDISEFRNYGKLSGVKNRSLKAGARVAADEYTKEEAEDFALWKAAKPGEPSWSAPFGKGRPGWHIECSAMAMQYLGQTFDIHAGGIDLLFPHHEDEIAQSEGATGKPFARFFVEGAHLLVDGRKMSKSLGNVYTLRNITTKGFSPLDFRFLVFMTHYRRPMNFSWKSLEAARAGRESLERNLHILQNGVSEKPLAPARNRNWRNQLEKLKKDFSAALADDLNMPRALSLFHAAAGRFAEDARAGRMTQQEGKQIAKELKKFDRVLGLRLGETEKETIPGAIQKLVLAREVLRKEKKWKEADAIREEIKKRGYAVADTPGGPVIKK